MVTIFICSLLIIIFCGCASLNTPLVFRPHSSNLIQSSNDKNASTWIMDSLTPNEGIKFTRRNNAVISVHLELHGEGEYAVQLSTRRKNFKPLSFITLTAEGQVDLSANIIWNIKPKGKIEIISIALYRIEKSISGKTEICTLIKQIRREYVVNCHRK